MPTRPYSQIRVADFLGVRDDLPLEADDHSASVLQNWYRKRRKLVRRKGQSAIGAGDMAGDTNLRGLEWAKIRGTEFLLAVHNSDVKDMFHATPGTILGNGTDKLPAAADANFAWIEEQVVIGNGTDQNQRFDGPPRLATQFTGADNDSLVNTTAADFLMSDVDFTVCAWVYLDSHTSNRDIFTLWDTADTNKQSWTLHTDSATSAFRWEVRNPSGTLAFVDTLVGTVTTGQWYFVVAWHDSFADTISIQVDNGAIVSTALIDGPRAIGPTNTPLRIGCVSTSGSPSTLFKMDGRIQSVAFFKGNESGNGEESGVLTAQQRADLYNAGNGRFYDQLSSYEKLFLIEWWDLDEASSRPRVGRHQGIVMMEVNTPTTAEGITAYKQVAQQMVPKCDGRPNLTLGSAGAVSPQGAISYRVSFVNADGRFGEAGPEATITLSTNNKIGLSNLPLCPSGQDCLGRAVWRKDSDMSVWQLAFTVMDNTTTSVEDTTVAANLTDTLEEGNAATPPFKFLAEWKGRLVGAGNRDDPQMVGISNLDQHYYTPEVPNLDDPTQGDRLRLQGRAAGAVTGIETHGGLVAIFTGGAGFLLQGNQPKNFTLQEFTRHGCTAHRTIVSSRDTLLWLSNDGVYAWVGGGAVTRISDDVAVTLEALTATQLAEAHAVVFEDRYYLFWDTGALYYDLQYRQWGQLTNNLWRCSTTSDFVDGNRTRIWGAQEDHARVYQLETGSSDAIPSAGTAITAVWASKDWDMGLPGREKRVAYVNTKFRKSTGTATITLYRGTGESIQTLSHNTADVVESASETVSRKHQSAVEAARSEHFRVQVSIASTATNVELLEAALEYAIAN